MTALPAHITKPDARGVERLALSLDETAKAIGCSSRHLQAQLKEKNIDLPSFRLGRLRLFPVDAIRKWISEQCETQG